MGFGLTVSSIRGMLTVVITADALLVLVLLVAHQRGVGAPSADVAPATAFPAT